MANVLTDNSGHKYMFSASIQKWVKIECSCDVTAPSCSRPAMTAKGSLQGSKRKRATGSDLNHFEAAMQILMSIPFLAPLFGG